MTDTTITLEQLKTTAAHFVAERDWAQYHSPKNLSMVVSIEAGELMEKFLWLTTQESIQEIEKNRQEIEHECADVLFALLCFANAANIDLSKAFEVKLAEIGKKYSVEKSKGRREKYTKL
ncbi:MAG: nucleotide pyrophosphohydrolase [Candidatus Dependentiae bacterium]|nr:nucleotide pyrophosphohydrolase [Candidatus Dependentiae bacterium]